jgi:putative peptidoglycan lipid II flippase
VKRENRKVAKAAGQISLATTASRVLGFIRDILLAKIFGASGFTDAFFIAYRIPNLFRELFAEGSMSAAFVPVFTETLSFEGEERAKRLASAVLAFLVIVLSAITVSGVLAAPWVVSVIAPGFLDEPEKFSLTVKLTRIMFPFLFFISLAALAKGILNSMKSFFVPALAPVCLNLSIITSALFVAPAWPVPLAAVAMAVSVGGALQIAVQVPDLYRRGFIVRPVINFAHPGLRKILRLMLPAVAGMGVAQINIFVSTIFVSYLSGGAATYLYYAMRFVHLPIGIFGVAMATAVLPSLSEYAARKDMESLRETYSFALRVLFFITLPAMAGLIVFAEPIIDVLLRRGEFSTVAVKETAYALVFYSVGLWAFVGARVAASTFYSLQDTKTPVKIAALSVIVNILFSLMLMGPMRHAGLAFANSIAAAANFLILFYLLRRRLGRLDGRNILASFGRTVFASVIMAVFGLVVMRLVFPSGAELLKRASALAVVIASCVVIYILISAVIKSRELGYLREVIRRKRRAEVGGSK